MTVTLSNGRVLKLQFVHSTADFASRRGVPVTPGGLRQFVDNLARSLHRRVTLCDISEVTPATDTTTVNYEAIGQGFAVCYYKDQFSKVAGRGFAIVRALNNTHEAGRLNADEADEILALFPKEIEFLANYGG